MHTQEITTTTIIKLDFWDSLKVLFGKKIKVIVSMEVPQSNEINSFNASETVEIQSHTSHHFSKDKPNFGWTLPASRKENA